MKLAACIRTPQRRQLGFTMVETIGVIVLIAILAAVIVPRVIGVIGRGKVNSTAQSVASIKTATMDYIGKNSSLPVRNGTGNTNGAVANGRFDADLVAGGFVEKLFTCGIGSQKWDTGALTTRTHLRTLTAASSAAVTAPTATAGGNNYDLDRDGATADFTTAQVVASVFIPGVALTDAIALNKIIDGDSNTGAGADTLGRCMYSAPVNNLVSVYVYVAHY